MKKDAFTDIATALQIIIQEQANQLTDRLPENSENNQNIQFILNGEIIRLSFIDFERIITNAIRKASDRIGNK